MKRTITLGAAAALLVGILAGPAGATKPDGGGHTITICHATNSAVNEYVVITIDVAAWQGGGNVRHSPDHHVNAKTGARDKVWDATLGCDEPGGGTNF